MSPIEQELEMKKLMAGRFCCRSGAPLSNFDSCVIVKRKVNPTHREGNVIIAESTTIRAYGVFNGNSSQDQK